MALRSSPSVFLHHAKWPLRAARRQCLGYWAKREAQIVKSANKPRWSPIFIVGAPRAGTTLVYQSILASFKVSYFLNLVDRLPNSPGLVTRAICRLFSPSPPRSFESSFGEIKGLLAPSHGRHIWARWFPGDQGYVPAGFLAQEQMQEIRGTIATIERAFDLPFFNKAQGHCVRILPLHEAFPEAVYLRVSRDHLQTAQSLLLGRKRYFGDAKKWFSVKPKAYDRIARFEPCQQICEQLFEIEKDLDRDLGDVAAGRVFDLQYESFCSDPNGNMKRFQEFYESVSGKKLVGRTPLPESFQVSSKQSANQSEYDELKFHIHRLWG